MELSVVKKLMSLEEENTRFEKIYGNLAIDNQILMDPYTNKGWALPQKNSYQMNW